MKRIVTKKQNWGNAADINAPVCLSTAIALTRAASFKHVVGFWAPNSLLFSTTCLRAGQK